jgi:2-phosphosulfolactate phosphatase
VRLDVALLPGQSTDYAKSVCIIVDVLRASSSIVTILDRGAAEVLPAQNIDAARALRSRFPGHTLCGEQGGLPPDDFDYGNSPSEFAKLDLASKSLILATSNGTRVLAAAAETAAAVLIGGAINRTAAARAALEIARARNLDITVICSAAHGGATFVLEDALGAAAIAEAAADADSSLQLSDTARFARDSFLQSASDISAAIRSAYHAQELFDAGLGDDVTYCAQIDESDTVPMLERGAEGPLILRPYGPLPLT